MSARLRILIVDDHAGFRAMLRSLLHRLGAEVVECRDGVEAMRCYDEVAPDWVLMDLEMPRLDGLAATRELIANHPQARVLVLTQHDDADSRDAAREAGARHFVPKDQLDLLPPILFSPSDISK